MTRVIKAVSLPLGSPALQWVLNIEAQGGNFSAEMRKLIEVYSRVYDEFEQMKKINRALKMKLLLQERKRARTKKESDFISEQIANLRDEINSN